MLRFGSLVQAIILIFFPFHLNHSSEEWTHHLALDKQGIYHVRWRVEEDTIYFLVEVKAKGYVGFGLSENGGMKGSDIVTGWIDNNGQTFFQDRHGLGNFMPVIDEKQNWQLLSGNENETHTVLEFRRKLNTCDDQDLVIDENAIRLIYAYSFVDPKSAEDLPYHSTNRGSRSVFLLQRNIHREVSSKNLLQWNVMSPNLTVNSDEKSVYWCKILKGPDVSHKHHIIQIEPAIQLGHEAYIHHMVLFQCDEGNEEELDSLSRTKGYYCYHPKMPEAMKNCETPFLSWSIGGETFVVPGNVGAPLSSPPRYYSMQMHYDNRLGHNFTDQSGIHIYYTPNLRENDAGLIKINAANGPLTFIPPGQKKYTIVGHANPDYLSSVIPPEGIKILGVNLHAHSRARHLITRHFRKNVELKPIAENKNYDFNYQNPVMLPEGRSYLKGDQMLVECTYNTEADSKAIHFGLTTSDEMCQAYVIYYPRVELFACKSGPTAQKIIELTHLNMSLDNLSNTEFYHLIQRYDWKSINVSNLENALRNTPHETFCYPEHRYNSSVRKFISYPKDYVPFHQPTHCIPDALISRGFDNRASIAVVTLALAALIAIQIERHLF